MGSKFIRLSLIATLLALAGIAVSPLLALTALLMRNYLKSLHRPVFTPLMVAATGILTLLAVAKLLRKLWSSAKMGLVQLALPVWSVGLFACWILLELHKLKASIGTIVCTTLAAFLLHKYQRRKIGPDLLSQMSVDPDLPIHNLREDLLGRRETVHTLVSLIVLEQPSVVGLTGGYGDGKTSVLNLTTSVLEEMENHKRPIVVRFNPWLPLDSDALVLSLLSAISQTIQSEYLIPRLSHESLQYAGTLIGMVPPLRNLKEIFKEPSQQTRIRFLAESISRLPRRILVILDDLDRLQADELETIFKLLRGTEELSNITFLCSFALPELCAILKSTRPNQDTDRFVQKFFQTLVPLPKIDSGDLRRVFGDRVKAVREKLGFPLPDTEQQFSKGIDQIWEEGGAKFFDNLRRIKRFLNKLGYSLSVIGAEVNLLDFIRLELIRDVWPALYESIYSNAELFFSTGFAIETWGRGFSPLDEREGQKLRAKAYEPIISSIPAEKQYILSSLEALFPQFASSRQSRVFGRETLDSAHAEMDRRICHPRFFRQYFLLRTPSELYSQTAWGAFYSAVRNATMDQALKRFNTEFNGMVNEEFKRWHFMHQISQRFDDFPIESAKGLCIGMARNSQLWQSDAFELAIATSSVITLHKKLSNQNGQGFLEKLLRESTSDLFSLSLVAQLEEKLQKKEITTPINILALKRLLISRFREQYMGSSPPSVFEKYPSGIDANQVMFAWRRLGQEAEQDQRDYLEGELSRNPKSLDSFLKLMFRGIDFLDDYAALKPLIEYSELLKIVGEHEQHLDAAKVREFRQRYSKENPGTTS
jgi:hypothetical protein